MSRRLARLASVAAVVLLLAPACAMRPSTDERADAAAALRAGRYDEALERYGRLANAAGATTADRRGLLRALAEVGRYDDAIAHAQRWTAGGDAALWGALGDLRRERGDRAGAEDAYRRALAAGAPDSLPVRLALAELRLERGEVDAALAELDRFIDVYNGARGRLTSADLAAVAAACRHLGRRDPQLFKDALRAYDEAIAADSLAWEPRLQLAELFLEKYNSPDAQATLQPVLAANPRHPRALWLAARLLRFDNAPGAAARAREALATNERFVPARVLLAQIALDAEAYAEAIAETERALAVDSTDAEALATLAAARWLAGDRAGFEAARDRALALDPLAPALWETLAEQGARNRLYRQAVEFAAEGARRDSTAWRTLALLGINELRVGRMADGRRHLERAFQGDPYDPWTKNTLDLLDATRRFVERRAGRFLFVADSAEAALLVPYLARLGEEAYDSLAARYGWRPEGPVRLELYRSHADFSVRTVGLAGLGALGVSFGEVLAMDSPGARDVGAFNWGSTFWHELAHTFTLGASAHRVPRWLSEGLSVLEERRARPGWGQDVSPAFLSAYAGGRVPPPSRLNDGFMRPQFPEQVILSYYQASLVCELIEREHGAGVWPKMLKAYADGMSTPQVFERVLGTRLDAFDRRYDAWVRERFGDRLAAVSGREGELQRALVEGTRLLEAKRLDEAATHLERAKRLFPELTGAESPSWLLAQLYRQRGDVQRAAAELEALTAVDEDFYEAHVQHAELLLQLGDSAGAARALDRAVWISPYDPKVHERLAVLAAATGDRRTAVRERQAVLALGPVDRAEALYQLALAHFQAGERAEARRAVLRALEDAPNFDRAQELLLRLQGDGAGEPR